MLIVDLLQIVLNAQACPPTPTDPDLPATALTAIGAAFATQGYWVQADLLDYLTLTNMGVWAPLLYVVAAAGGLMSLAMGMPPKLYLWFFIGPAIYAWLLDTRVETFGVRWTLPCLTAQQRTILQAEVWKYAEVGLVNTNLARRMGDPGVSRSRRPEQSVRVSYFFLWFDDLISGTIFALIEWTGVYTLQRSQNADTNITFALDPSQNRANYWYLLADTKWTMLEQITGARLASPNLRDQFASFFGTECGDALRRSLSPEALVSATTSKGRTLPATVFDVPAAAINATPRFATEYTELVGRLSGQGIKKMERLTALINQGGPGAFVNSIGPANKASSGTWQDFREDDTITCADYFYLLVSAFRWEAGHIYHQLITTVAPSIVSPEEVVTNFLYGWDIRANRETDPTADPTGTGNEGTPLSLEEQQAFLQDLILAYLFRNELLIAPTALSDEQRYTNPDKVRNYVRDAQAGVGSKSKFGELYTWSLLIPYIQGLLLYFLAMAYPFACVLIVVPGWHKIIFTWMSFWAWAKMWDLGFAIVRSLERSIWAMIGNSTDSALVNDRIVTMQQFGGVNVTCPGGGAMCPIPEVALQDPNGNLFDLTVAGESLNRATESVQIFDMSVILSGSLDLDVANAYYIYVMSALYFAVPAVTGQLVLGAKAGAASMVNSMIGGVSGEAGRAAGSGFTGEYAAHSRANAASDRGARFYKAMRAEGHAARALELGIAAAEQERLGAAAGAMKGHYDKMMNSIVSANQVNATLANATGDGLRMFMDPHKHMANKIGFDPWPAAAAAGAGGAGAGAGGSGATGGAMSLLPGPLQALGGGAAMLKNGGDAAAALAVAAEPLGAYGRQARTAEAANEIMRAQAGWDNVAFGANQAASQFNNARQNLMGYAQGSAELAAATAQNNYSAALGGRSAAVGVMAGQYSAEQMMPTSIEYGAPSGHAGGAAQRAAWHFDPQRGSYGQGTQAWLNQLTPYSAQGGHIHQALNSNLMNPGQIIGASFTASGKVPEAFSGVTMPGSISVFGQQFSTSGFSGAQPQQMAQGLAWQANGQGGTDKPYFKSR